MFDKVQVFKKHTFMSCLTYYGSSNLVFYEGKMDSSKCIEIHDANLPLIFNLVPALCCRRKLFQHHNAKLHVSARTKVYMKKNRINVLSWPANSWDITIEENMWSIMDDKSLK